ncbi:NUDIX hydrolase [Microbacterium sp. 179-I 1D1 NHS]|uniref:NUDIX hydrolase n=1 Tax=unclassified Microbacterium TaxID=2609290 RepID=UPI00387A552A
MDIRVAAYAVIVEDDRILLAHWNSPTRPAWTMPGGGLDPGEDPMDAAVREVLEETGFHVELDGILGTDSQVIAEKDRFHGSGPIQALRIVYRARVVGGELRNEEEGSTDEAAWFPVREVATLTRVGLVDTAMRMAGLIA